MKKAVPPSRPVARKSAGRRTVRFDEDAVCTVAELNYDESDEEVRENERGGAATGETSGSCAAASVATTTATPAPLNCVSRSCSLLMLPPLPMGIDDSLGNNEAFSTKMYGSLPPLPFRRMPRRDTVGIISDALSVLEGGGGP